MSFAPILAPSDLHCQQPLMRDWICSTMGEQMSKHNYKIAAIFFVFMVLSRAADNPFTGKWKIDASKSSFSDGTFPKNMSIVIDLNFRSR